MDPTAPIPFRAAQAHAAYGPAAGPASRLRQPARPTVSTDSVTLSGPAATAAQNMASGTVAGTTPSTAPHITPGRVINGVIVPPLAKNSTRGAEINAAGGDRASLEAAKSDAFRLDVTSRRDHLSATLSALIAGQVESPVGRGMGFDGDPLDARRRTGPMPATVGQPLQMYTRAADRIDVATSLRLGGNLDTRA